MHNRKLIYIFFILVVIIVYFISTLYTNLESDVESISLKYLDNVHLNLKQYNYNGIKMYIEKRDIKIYVFELYSKKDNKSIYGHVIYKRKFLNFFERVAYGSSNSKNLKISQYKLSKNRYVLFLYGENLHKKHNTISFQIGNTIYIENIGDEEFYFRYYERIYEEDVQAVNFEFF